MQSPNVDARLESDCSPSEVVARLVTSRAQPCVGISSLGA